jgi:hypothetical protein
VRSGQQGLRSRSATFLVLEKVFREGLSKTRKAIIPTPPQTPPEGVARRTPK